MVLLLFLLSTRVVEGQLQITNNPPYNTANHLIDNVFSDGSVSITNINVFGDPSQYGFFSNGNAAVAMDSGIVLATRELSTITNFWGAPNAPSPLPPQLNQTTGVNFGFPWMGNPTTNNLKSVSASVPGLINQSFSTPNNINSACAISFDFVPQDDTMKFKFVFASDEWNSFPCTQYNDVFGFFVSGPGINGPFNAPPGYTNAENFARIPGTNIPITISSITSPFNTGSCNTPQNSQYYVNANTGGLTLTARTDTMEVVFPVQRCETYNFTMAIANGQDVALQSAVFLQGNSFGTGESVDINVQSNYGFGGDSIVFEGCDSTTITFRRNDTVLNEDTIFLNIFGQVVNGVDISPIPDTLFFSQGQDSISFSFIAYNDGIVQGYETLYIAIDSATVDLGCSQFTSDTIMLVISDPIPIDYTISNDTIMCTDPPVNVNVNVTDGLPDFEYLWGNNDTTSSFTVPAPTQDTSFAVRVIDACNNDTVFDTARITVINPPTTISAGSDTIDCETPDASIFVVTTDSMPGLDYEWSTSMTGAQFTESNPLQTTDYIVTVTQTCADYFLVDTFTLVVDNPPFTVDLIPDTVDCIDPQVELAPIVSYTTPNFSYEWSTNDTDSTITVQPLQTTLYTVSVTDACGQNTEEATVEIVVVANPITLSGSNRTVPCVGDEAVLEVNMSGGFPPYDILWDNGTPDSVNTVTVNQPDTHVVRVTDVCGIDTVTRTFYTFLQEYDPVIFNLQNDTLFCAGDRYFLGPPNLKGGSGDFEVSWNQFDDKRDITYGITDTNLSFTFTVADICTGDTADTNLQVILREFEPLEVMLPPDTAVCPDDLFRIPAKVEGGVTSKPYSFRWNTGETDSVLINRVNTSQTYTLEVTDYCGEKVTKSIQVERSIPNADFTYEFVDAFNVLFENESRDANRYVWNFGDGDTSHTKHPLHEYQSDRIHYVMLTAVNEAGCKDSISKELTPRLQVFIPNAFSPNDDGLNDVFEIQGVAINNSRAVSKFNIQIFDRWGSLLYRSNNPEFQWDGTNKQGQPCQQGVYVYKIMIEGYGRQKIEKQGTITIVK